MISRKTGHCHRIPCQQPSHKLQLSHDVEHHAQTQRDKGHQQHDIAEDRLLQTAINAGGIP